MVEIEKRDEKQISSVELIGKSGISRATLNNYINMGILPRPLVKKPADPVGSRAKRIGYFPLSALDTLDMIIQYKKEGRRMDEISRLLVQKPHLSSEESLNKKMTSDAGNEVIPRGASGFGNESGELFSFAEMHAGDVTADTRTKREIKALRQGRLNLLHFSVLVVEIQDATKMCAELPPEEYIDLIRRIWKSMALTFNKHLGVYGKHSGNGAVFYFLKDRDSSYLMNPIVAALELREIMIHMSHEWIKENRHTNDLFLNMGISEGHEFVTTNPASPAEEYISLGDALKSASRLSDLARSGAIWTTKNLLNLMDEKQRRRIRYGIYRTIRNQEVLVENIFSRVRDLLPHDDQRYNNYKDIWTLPVTEIQAIR